MQICAEMHLGLATTLATSVLLSMQTGFFVSGYHNNLRNIDLLENNAP